MELTHLQLKTHEDEGVQSLVLWIATQIASDTTEHLAARERGENQVNCMYLCEIFL